MTIVVEITGMVRTADATDAETRTAEIITVVRIIVAARIRIVMITVERTGTTRIVARTAETITEAERTVMLKIATIAVVTTVIEMRTAGITTAATDAVRTVRRTARIR